MLRHHLEGDPRYRLIQKSVGGWSLRCAVVEAFESRALPGRESVGRWLADATRTA